MPERGFAALQQILFHSTVAEDTLIIGFEIDDPDIVLQMKSIKLKSSEGIIATQLQTNVDSTVNVVLMLLDQGRKEEKAVRSSGAIRVSNFAFKKESGLFTPS